MGDVDTSPAHHVVFVLSEFEHLALRGIVAGLHLFDAHADSAEGFRLLAKMHRIRNGHGERNPAQRGEHHGRRARGIILEGQNRAEIRFTLAYDLKIAVAEHDPLRHDQPTHAPGGKAEGAKPAIRDQMQRLGDLRKHHVVFHPHTEAAHAVTGEASFDPSEHRLEILHHDISGFGALRRAAAE